MNPKLEELGRRLCDSESGPDGADIDHRTGRLRHPCVFHLDQAHRYFGLVSTVPGRRILAALHDYAVEVDPAMKEVP